MRLAHPESRSLIHRRARRDVIDQANTDAVGTEMVPSLRQRLITSRSTCGLCECQPVRWREILAQSLDADPGSAILRCCSAKVPAGVTCAAATCSLFFQPLTTCSSPAIIAS